MHLITRLICLSAFFLITACGSMSKTECLAVNWRALGYEDGARGMPADYMGRRNKACAKHGVAIDMDSYLGGRNEGLLTFCRPQNGFDFGARGGAYRGVCPRGLERPFLAAYQKGAFLHQLEDEANALYSALQSAKNRLTRLNRELIDAEADLILPDIPVSERARRALEVKDIIERREALKYEIADLEIAYNAKALEADDYRASLHYNTL